MRVCVKGERAPGGRIDRPPFAPDDASQRSKQRAIRQHARQGHERVSDRRSICVREVLRFSLSLSCGPKRGKRGGRANGQIEQTPALSFVRSREKEGQDAGGRATGRRRQEKKKEEEEEEIIANQTRVGVFISKLVVGERRVRG